MAVKKNSEQYSPSYLFLSTFVWKECFFFFLKTFAHTFKGAVSHKLMWIIILQIKSYILDFEQNPKYFQLLVQMGSIDEKMEVKNLFALSF